MLSSRLQGADQTLPRSRPPVPDHSIPDVEDDASERNRPGVNSHSQDGETNLRIVMHHKCSGKKADGTACGALAHLLDEEGFCPAHRPGGRETMAERGRKGGLATMRKVASPGLNPEELPDPRTHVDALNLA